MNRPAAFCLALVLLLAAGGADRGLALEGLEAGHLPPDFSLGTVEGDRYTTGYFSGSAGAIVFWSTWSPRSAEILEDFRGYHETYGPQGLKILAINIDGENLTGPKLQAVVEYAAEQAMPFPVLLDKALAAFAAYGVMAHPSAVIISRKGRISYTLGGYPLSLRAELEDEIQKVLDIYTEPPPSKEPAAGFYPAGGALQHYKMGLTLLARGQPERALHAFNRAREQDPNFLEPAVMSARVRLAGGDIGPAEELLHEFDLTLINRNDLRYILGLVLLYKDSFEGAESQFLALRRKSPGENWGYWGLAIVHLHRAEYFEALEQLRMVPAAGVGSPELESYIREHLVDRWRKGQTVEWEKGFLELFPKLQGIRKQYEIMFSSLSRGS